MLWKIASPSFCLSGWAQRSSLGHFLAQPLWVNCQPIQIYCAWCFAQIVYQLHSYWLQLLWNREIVYPRPWTWFWRSDRLMPISPWLDQFLVRPALGERPTFQWLRFRSSVYLRRHLKSSLNHLDFTILSLALFVSGDQVSRSLSADQTPVGSRALLGAWSYRS